MQRSRHCWYRVTRRLAATRLARAVSPKELLDAADDVRDWQPFHFGHLMNSLAKLGDAGAAEVAARPSDFARVVEALAEAAPSFRKPVELVRAAVGLSRLPTSDEAVRGAVERFARAWSQQASVRLEFFNELELSNAVLALGNLRVEEEALAEGFLSAWQRETMRRMPHLEAQALCVSVQGLGKLKAASVDDAFYREWSAAVMARMHQFDDQSLVTSMYALARLGVGPAVVGKEFFAKWVELTTVRLSFMTEQGLANSIYALAILQTGPNELGMGWFREWADVAADRFDGFSEQQMSNTIYACGKLKLDRECIGDDVFVKWAASAARRMRNFWPQGLSNSIYSLGLLNLGPKEIGVEFFQKWAAAFVYRFDSMLEQHLANSIYAMGRLRLRPHLGDEFCLAIAKAVEARLNEFPVLGLSNVLSGMEMLQIGPAEVGPDWFRKWVAVAPLEKFNLKDLCRAIASLAGLSVGPEIVGETFFVNWTKQVLKPSIVFDLPLELVFMLDGLKKLNLGPELLGYELGKKVLLNSRGYLDPKRKAVLSFLGVPWDVLDAHSPTVAGAVSLEAPAIREGESVSSHQ